MSNYIVQLSHNKNKFIENNTIISFNLNRIIFKNLKTDKEICSIILNHNLNNNNLQIFNDENLIYILDNNIEYFILFDNNSKSAFNSLVKDLELKYHGKLYYDSGNLRMEGEFTFNKQTGYYSGNGDCKVYHNNPAKTLLYEGEIEDENYDGAGIFYNLNQNISLKINNIDKNTPIGQGILTIKNYDNSFFYEKNFKFDDIQDINLKTLNLDLFVIDKLPQLFPNLLNYDIYLEEFNIQSNINKKLNEYKQIPFDKQNYYSIKKLVELEMKFDKFLNEFNDLKERLNEPKQRGFFGF